MKQRLKGFILLTAIIFIITYIASEYFAKKIDAEVELYNQRLSILYNTHNVLNQAMSIQEDLYGFHEGSDLLASRFARLDKSMKDLLTSISMIHYIHQDDNLFRSYSHHVEVTEVILSKYMEKINTVLAEPEGPVRDGYLKEAIEIGEGMEVFLSELDKFLDEEYQKVSSSLPTITEELRWIRDITGTLFFLGILFSAYMLFYSCKPMKIIRPFLRSIKEGECTSRVEEEEVNEECVREMVSTFNFMLERVNEGSKASESLTITDPLTGIYNRRYFDIRLDEEMNRSIRYGTIFSLSIIDIDHFKEINDKFGHQAGDSVLKEMMTLIMACVRETDILARYGGEEFVIIYPCTPKSGVLTQIERLRQNVEEHKFMGIDRKVTISIGAADSSAKTNAYQVVREADNHLYMAKSQGRNKCIISGVSA